MTCGAQKIVRFWFFDIVIDNMISWCHEHYVAVSADVFADRIQSNARVVLWQLLFLGRDAIMYYSCIRPYEDVEPSVITQCEALWRLAK